MIWLQKPISLSDMGEVDQMHPSIVMRTITVFNIICEYRLLIVNAKLLW